MKVPPNSTFMTNDALTVDPLLPVCRSQDDPGAA